MLHTSVTTMVKEALPEYVDMAGIAIKTRKENGGVHGFPAALLLFAVVDAIGSYYRYSDLRVPVDGRTLAINGDDWRHFLVLNSPLYGQTLTESQLKSLYSQFRNPLTHNAGLRPGTALAVGDLSDAEVFHRRVSGEGPADSSIAWRAQPSAVVLWASTALRTAPVLTPQAAATAFSAAVRTRRCSALSQQ